MLINIDFVYFLLGLTGFLKILDKNDKFAHTLGLHGVSGEISSFFQIKFVWIAFFETIFDEAGGFLIFRLRFFIKNLSGKSFFFIKIVNQQVSGLKTLIELIIFTYGVGAFFLVQIL